MTPLNKIFLGFFAFFSFVCSSNFAREAFSLTEFKKILILENGRKKPLEAYARSLLLQFSGKSTFNGNPAIHWLARVFFIPDSTLNEEIYKITNSNVLNAIGVRDQKKRRYSFKYLAVGFTKLNQLAGQASEIESKQRTPEENEILRLYHNLSAFAGILSGFRFAHPQVEFQVMEEENRALLNLPEGKQLCSYWDLIGKLPNLGAKLDFFKNKPNSEWTRSEIELFRISQALFKMHQQYQAYPPPIFPSWKTEKNQSRNLGEPMDFAFHNKK